MKESEIRPKLILEKYLALSKIDGETMDKNLFEKVSCPGCHKKNTREYFKKNNFTLHLCEECNSLYCNPRPSKTQLKEFYNSSPSSKYWSEVFFPSTAEARREKLFRKKAKIIAEIIQSSEHHTQNFCDIGAGMGIFLEELQSILPRIKYSAIEPSPNLASFCRSKKFDVLETIVEEASLWENKFDMALSTEVVEHVFDMDHFIHSIYKLLAPRGIAIVTGVGHEGFDTLFLKEKSNSISPPHHLNFLSIKGFTDLFERQGFKVLKIWTPGELDVDIVLNSDPLHPLARALRQRGEECISQFQKFLTNNQLSSHIWIKAQKI